MAEQVTTSKGTYSVSPTTSYKCGWRLRHKSWIDKKPVTAVVPLKPWLALGFTPSMSIDEARARIVSIPSVAADFVKSLV